MTRIRFSKKTSLKVARQLMGQSLTLTCPVVLHFYLSILHYGPE